ncbi:MAG: succinate dehydrogenase [Chitinophagia bacterium]|jgi:succinate dehydrogenase / fumarate reductase cytochrome b subunit|nr:succinate dehydrogenase [Chitinophagia bacterium]
MTSKQFFTSSIGKKITMGLTGFFLISFLIVHCSINAMIFFNDGGQTFNHWGHFMGSNLLIRTAEIGLFVFLLIHIIQGLLLWKQNRSARPVKYIVTKPNENSKWYSRSMGLLGTLILIFLILHLYHFWTPSRFGGIANVRALEETTLSDYNNQPVHDLFKEMLLVFQNNLLVVIVYVLGVISLCWHLLHGFQSAFQTFGWNHKKYTPLIKSLGVGYSIIICLLFAMMPIAIYLHWIG